MAGPRVSPQRTGQVRPGRLDVAVAADHCVGCLACADVCQPDALRLLPGAWAVDVDVARCTGCRRCETACPFGVITVSGATRTRHQVVVDSLASALQSTCPAGWRISTTGPAFWTALGQPTVVPDLAVVGDDTAAGPWPRQERTVALVVEVVAPSTREMDLGRKRDLYWQREVASYWTVDQRTGQVTVQWSLRPAWFDRWAAFTFA
jgi:ferredoxin